MGDFNPLDGMEQYRCRKCGFLTDQPEHVASGCTGKSPFEETLLRRKNLGYVIEPATEPVPGVQKLEEKSFLEELVRECVCTSRSGIYVADSDPSSPIGEEKHNRCEDCNGWVKELTENDIHYIDLTEFVNFGFLQEINRKFLHPLGLALSVVSEEDGTISGFSGIWDYRGDPDGIRFDEGLLATEESREKALRVQQMASDRYGSRMQSLGYFVQPVPGVDDVSMSEAKIEVPKPFKIIVNGKELIEYAGVLTYSEIVVKAFGNNPPNVLWTITYRRPLPENVPIAGILGRDEYIHIENGMIFNVANTGAA